MRRWPSVNPDRLAARRIKQTDRVGVGRKRCEIADAKRYVVVEHGLDFTLRLAAMHDRAGADPLDKVHQPEQTLAARGQGRLLRPKSVKDLPVGVTGGVRQFRR